MKKTRYILALCAVCLTLLLSSCAKEESLEPLGKEGRSTLGPSDPTGDRLMAASKTPAYLFTSGNTDFGMMVCNRFCNLQNSLNSAETRLAVVDGAAVESLTPEQWKQLAGLFYRGGCIVYLDPTLQQYADFASQARSTLAGMGYSVDEVWDVMGWLDYFVRLLEVNPGQAGTRFEAVAMTADDVYLVADQGRDARVQFGRELVDRESGRVDSSVAMPGTMAHMTPYRRGLVADRLVLWADRVCAAQGKRAKASDDGAKVVTLQVPITFDPLAFAKLDKQGWQPITVPCEIEYTIWSVYDLNQHKDNYVIYRNIEFDGSLLSCGPEEEDEWWCGTDYHYGPYLHSIEVQSRFDGPSPSLIQWNPQNAMTSTTYSNGMNWGLNGGLSIGAKPGINIGANVVFTKSVSTTVPDLKMEVWRNICQPKYEYKIGHRPQGHFWGGSHDIVAANLRQDISMQQYWTWVVDPAEGASYSFATDFSVQVEFLRSAKGFFEMKDYYEWVKVPYDNIEIALPAPPRAVQEWRMYCQDPDPSLNTFLNEYYEGYFYNRLFQMPAATETERQSIDRFIDNFMTRLECDRDLWSSRGFTGTYTFVWKPSTSPDIYRTTTFDNHNSHK